VSTLYGECLLFSFEASPDLKPFRPPPAATQGSNRGFVADPVG
jgi:hypothetical protein